MPSAYELTMSASNSSGFAPSDVLRIFIQRMPLKEVTPVALASTSAVALESVSKTFRQRALFTRWVSEEVHALRNVSFELGAGEILGLLGPNGSGKSTTLKLVSTLLLPDSGRVTVAGFETRACGQQVRRRVGFALASERSFFPRLTARENLEFFAALEDISRYECCSRTEHALVEVGLADVAGKQVMKFSSGMHQRLAIARALLKGPQVLLLDEPSRSLDVAAAARLWDLIQELSRRGISVLLATHNFAEAAEVCDRVAILQKGALMEVLPTANQNERQLRDCYLDITREPGLVRWNEEVPA
jgi:ABC-2 type transport system ATP-binding protein